MSKNQTIEKLNKISLPPVEKIDKKEKDSKKNNGIL